VTPAQLVGIWIVGIRVKPLLERTPMQRLVAIPIVGRRSDERLQPKPGVGESRCSLGECHEPLIGDSLGEGPSPPVRLTDDDVTRASDGRS